MNTETQLTSYDFFCDFAWERLEDVVGLNRELGLPSFSPYVEFVEGCAFTCLFELTQDEQVEYFGFTLNELQDDLMLKFVKEFS